MSVIIDTVYMLVNDETRGSRAPQILYSPPATNASDCWTNACLWDQITGECDVIYKDREYRRKWIKSMYDAGWRAKRVRVESVDPVSPRTRQR